MDPLFLVMDIRLLKKIKMFQDIQEQPEILAGIWRNRLEIAAFSKAFPLPRFVFFTAFGSSYHASLYGQLLFYRFLGIPAIAATPGFFLQASRKFSLKNSLVIAISQSGEVQEVIESVQLLKKKGGKTLAITNHLNSPLAKSCHAALPLQAGEERSIPATKTFTATLFSLELLAGFWGVRPWLKSLKTIPQACREILEKKATLLPFAEKLGEIHRAFLLSPESLKAIALEGSLKFNECARLMMEAMEWREFFHGPVSLAEKEVPIFYISPAESLRRSADFLRIPKLLRLFRKWKLRAFPIPLLSSDSRNDLPSQAIPYAVVFQLLSLYTALQKGFNPDQPPHLHKVTQTP